MVMVSTPAVEHARGTITWQRQGRYAAAACFVGSSLLWFVSDLASFAARGSGRPAFTKAHPDLVGLAVSADMLSVPLMFGTVVVWYLLGRVASPRVATAGAVLLVCGTAGQGILIGVDVATYVINSNESDRLQAAAFDVALDVPGPVTAIELVACVWLAVAIVRAPQREGQGARRPQWHLTPR
jgi:hypothetical protein